ncbi:MAG: SCP2 sterol-binding domain-containing protein [Bradymonadales bacterium]|nr:SCP2 sterol-binding domain-containing protein [Bradymonadales bacterium]
MAKSVTEIFESLLPAGIAKNKDTAMGINAVYQFDITGENGGTWVVDLTRSEDWVSKGPSDAAQCTIEVSDQDWIDIIQGNLNAMQAFMMGKLRVSGDLGLATQLQQIFSMT